MITAIRPDESKDTYRCPICGREYRICDEPTCKCFDGPKATLTDQVAILARCIDTLTERVTTLEKQAKIARNQQAYRNAYEGMR